MYLKMVLVIAQASMVVVGSEHLEGLGSSSCSALISSDSRWILLFSCALSLDHATVGYARMLRHFGSSPTANPGCFLCGQDVAFFSSSRLSCSGC